MLSLVTAAEQQYRFDASTRARENAIIVAIRDRKTALAHAAPATMPRARVAWARPIGAHLDRAQAYGVACATA